ncbi:hypothetical protein X742_33675 [Mesorhizobium sp. LNHC232B00]|nr:hypothetical protein X742_33675 [Mesorhizobium sp. LNHC232B00]
MSVVPASPALSLVLEYVVSRTSKSDGAGVLVAVEALIELSME